MALTATTVSQAVTATARSIIVASATGFSVGKHVHIGNEAARVVGVTNTQIELLRGIERTNAKAHIVGDVVLVGDPQDFNQLAGSLVGTPVAGVTAKEIVDGRHHITELTFSALAIGSPTGAAALAFGKLMYTLPAGAIIVRGSRIYIALQGGGTVDADTPDGGLGTTVGSGVVSVLGGTAAFENIMTGQTFNDCNGTAEVKTIETNLSIETGGDKTVYFNLADTWAGADDITGTGKIVLEWTRMD